MYLSLGPQSVYEGVEHMSFNSHLHTINGMMTRSRKIMLSMS